MDPTVASRFDHTADVNMQEARGKFVLFGVTAGEDLHLAQIAVQDCRDDQFFEELKTKYNEIRGLFRRWFGIWRYSHCDFVKVFDARYYRMNYGTDGYSSRKSTTTI
jgi:hypothetical protein